MTLRYPQQIERGRIATFLAVGRWRFHAVPIAHAIALAGDVVDLGAMQEAVQNGPGRRPLPR